MEDISYPILHVNEVTQTIFSVNDIQVIFNTDVKTGTKLENDEVLKDYLRAVVQAGLLLPQGIENTDKITSIERLTCLDDSKTVIALDITTNVQQGVEELRCFITEERICNEEVHSEDSSSWNQATDVPSGPTLRWNSEMTTLLIQIRGDMDREFAKSKYKFRLWEKVAAKLNVVLKNVQVSAKDCDDKWRNIVATYRKNIDKLKCFGDNSVRWEYFTAMDNILKLTKDLSESLPNTNIKEDHVKIMNELANPEVEVKSERFEIIDVSAEHSSVEEIELDDEELTYDVVITRTSHGEKRKWSTEQCLTLIFLRNQTDHKFKESYENAPYLWKNLALQLNEKFLADFSPSELESAWNHCVISYEINLENLKSNGVNTVKWKYFAVMDEIRGGTNEISEISVPRPGEHLLKKFHELQLKNSLHLTESLLADTDSLTSFLTCTEKDESDSEDNSFSSFSGVVWTRDMVKMLISLKKLIEKDIVKHKIPRKKQWMIVVRRFRMLKNIKLTEEACEEKWRNLVRTYKKNLVRVKKRGVNVIKWPYFWKMWEILGNSVLEKERPSMPYLTEFKTKSRLNDNLTSNLKSSIQSSMNDDFMDYDEDILDDKINERQENLKEMISDLRNTQNILLQEIINIQNKKIEELHQEQLNIKSLLMQLLQKFQ